MKRIFVLTLYIFFGFLTKNAFAFEPITASAALAALTAAAGTAGVGYGIYDIFRKKKKQSVDDPNAAIRAQLQSIAMGIPGLIERQKELLSKRYADLRTEGEQGIMEDVYGTRGLGRTSIFDRLKMELVDKLAKSQAEAELQAELGGVEMQGSLLGRAAGIQVPTEEEQPSIFSKLLGYGSELAGQELGYGRLGDIFKPQQVQREMTYIPDWVRQIKSRPGLLTMTANV